MGQAVEKALNEYSGSLKTFKLFGETGGWVAGSSEEGAILFSTDEEAKNAKITEFSNLRNQEKYTTDQKNILNTHALPYAFTLTASGNKTTYPEVAMMIIKTYIKQLIPGGYLDPKLLQNVFGRNQELIELPYPIALYLGGLYYFKINEPITAKIKDNDNLFSIINGISETYKVNSQVINASGDVYASKQLNRMGLTYATDESTGIGQNGTTTQVYERIFAPSMRVLNRSVYDLHTSNSSTFDQKFEIKIGKDGERADTLIPVKTIMPPVGFGIQNKFLNHYNKTMFGDYLNGTKDLLVDGVPHSVIGGFCGISKPIKTYQSYDLEFTALYRNLHVGAFSYKIDDLVSELDATTKGIKFDYEAAHPFGSTATNENISVQTRPDLFIDEKKYVAQQDNTYVHNAQIEMMEEKQRISNENAPFEKFVSDDFPTGKIIKTFVTYSKLKALYLNNSITNKAELRDALNKLCSIKNIDSVFNRDMKSQNKHQISDFYWLVSHVFFASYKKTNKNHQTPEGKNYYSLGGRLNFGAGNNNYRQYQLNCLTDDLDKILNPDISSKDDEVIALSNFLSYVWGLERMNLKPEFNKVGNGTDMKAVYALYPSCGGAITPVSLLKNSERSLEFKFNNYIDNDFALGTNAAKTGLHSLVYKNPNSTATREYLKVDKPDGVFGDDILNNAPTYSVGGGKGYGEGPKSTITAFIDDESKAKFKSLLAKNNIGKDNKDFSFNDTPLANKYFIDPTYDTNSFLLPGFDNKIVLKNTTRFFWFDPTTYGEDLKQEYILNDNFEAIKPDFKYTGVDEMLNYSDNKDYYTLNSTTCYYSGAYQKLKPYYLEQYKINSLLDSLDFEKLEKFKELFIEFSKLTSKTNPTLNEANYTLRTLMLASTIVTYDHIDEFQIGGLKFTVDDVNLMLIGNSIFQYEFLSESTIAMHLNTALTKAQAKITDNVIDEFCSSLITVANFSPNTPIAMDKDSVSSMHKVIGLPEILFSNRPSYDEILTLLEKTTDEDKNKMGVYFTRRILFGDQPIEPYEELGATSKMLADLKTLNKKYLINKLYTYKKYNDNDDNVEELYVEIVKSFFKLINVKMTYLRYKQLNRLIRTYVYKVLKSNDILNELALPSSGIITDPIKFKTDLNIG